MAIRWIIGKAGAGKSRRCFDEICAELRAEKDGAPLVLLVPEQMTQAADRVLASECGGTVRAQSFSFRRLAFRVMQEVAGAARIHIDDTGKKMLLYKIARRRQSELKAFRRMSQGQGWIDALAEWFAECKRYRIDADKLKAIAHHDEGGRKNAGSGGSERGEPDRLSARTLQAAEGMLKDKLSDLSLLYEDLEAELAGKFVDSEDYLSTLAELIPQSAYIRSARIWVDSFHGFTPSEMGVLEALFRHAAEVTITLCLDRDYEEWEEPDELDLFHPTATTLLKLKRLAQEEGIRIRETVRLSEAEKSRHADRPALAALTNAFIERESGRHKMKRPLPAPIGRGAISICTAANPRAEAEAAAREIIRLVAEEGYRWRDVAAFIRNWEGYADVLSAVFADYGIPCFLDQKRAVLHHPLVELLRSALEVVQSRWSYDSVFRCVKTDLLLPKGAYASPTEERYAMDKLENYVLEYGIHGSRWTDNVPWKLMTMSSLEDEEQEESDARALAEERRIHRARTQVAKPLRRLEERLKAASTMSEQAEALYLLLEETGASEKLEAWREAAEGEGLPERAREHEQLWDRVIDTFDQLVELVGDEPADLELFAGMLGAGLESIRMGLVPPALDAVLVGNLDRTRAFGVKRLFLLGVNDGVIPMRPKENGVITETERERLLEQGHTIAPDARRRMLDERFLLYCALSLPSEGLWISYALSDPEGKSLLPSEYVRVIKQLAPQEISEYTAWGEPPAELSGEEAARLLTGPERAVSELLPQLRRWRRGERVSGVWWSVYNWLSGNRMWSERLRELTPSLFYTNRNAPLSEETSRELFGPVLRSSVSRLERFAACPFSHYAAYGLRLKERRMYRLEAPDIGQLYHAALSQLAKRLAEEGRTWADLSPEECIERSYAIVDELSPRLMAEILFSSSRHRYITRKLKGVVGRAAGVLREQARRTHFRQAAAELEFSPEGAIPPLRFELPNGVTMELSGRIDRLDQAQGDAGVFIRVIDYKSSAHRLRLEDVYYGLSLQLLAYLDAAAANAEQLIGTAAEPAGALYFHVHKPLLSSDNAQEREKAEAELFRKYKMRGLLLDDSDAVRLMDAQLERGHSPIVPIELKTDGTLSKRSSAADRSSWRRLRAFVRGKIAELGTEVSGGSVEASPYRRGEEKACTFCRFKAVCGFDAELSGCDYRSLPPLSDEQVWDKLGKEDGNDNLD